MARQYFVVESFPERMPNLKMYNCNFSDEARNKSSLTWKKKKEKRKKKRVNVCPYGSASNGTQFHFF